MERVRRVMRLHVFLPTFLLLACMAQTAVAREMVDALEPLGPEERLRFLTKRAPSRTVPFLLRHRYLITGVLFNVPGNALIGGGGGIGLIAGMSRLFPFPKYLLLVCLAISPGPILFLLRACLS